MLKSLMTLSAVMTASLLSLSPSVSHAQFGDLLKGLKDAAKELEKGTQQGAEQQGNPPSVPEQQTSGQTPPSTTPQLSNTPPAPAKQDKEAAWKLLLASKANEIKEYDEKSKQFASKSKTKWKSFSQSDAMTGEKKVLLRTEGRVGSGGYTAELTCSTGLGKRVAPTVTLEFNLQRLTVPIRRLSQGSTLMVSDGRERVNGNVGTIGFIQSEKFSNVFSTVVQTVFEGRLAEVETYGFTEDSGWKVASPFGNQRYLDERFGPKKYVYDSMYELTTNAGKILVEVPSGDLEFRKLLDSCGSGSK